MTKIKNFFKDESGATMIEYGLLVAILSIAAISILPGLAASVLAAFTSANGAMQ